MPIVTRTTVTTTRSTAGFRSSTIPVWVIKLLTVKYSLPMIYNNQFFNDFWCYLNIFVNACAIQSYSATFYIILSTVFSHRSEVYTIFYFIIKVIALVVLLLVYMQDKAIRAGYSTTFIVIALTCGILLGWSIGSVLQQVFFIRTVEILVNVILTVLAILSLIVAVAFLLERSDWSRYESYRLMVGISICFLLQSIVCILMLSWAFYGNLIIVESR
uniref:Uncharacterized protein n=1 Tax=Ascaris lumbricoides TaxID=6252 RepID=A0A0M3HZ11_ASCLU